MWVKEWRATGHFIGDIMQGFSSEREKNDIHRYHRVYNKLCSICPSQEIEMV